MTNEPNNLEHPENNEESLKKDSLSSSEDFSQVSQDQDAVNLEYEDKTFASAKDCYVTVNIPEAPYKSKFKKWIRAVAVVVLLTFIPDQVSWAFNYNPFVLWAGRIPQFASVGPMANMGQPATPQQMTSLQISQSVAHLLNQIANKPRNTSFFFDDAG